MLPSEGLYRSRCPPPNHIPHCPKLHPCQIAFECICFVLGYFALEILVLATLEYVHILNRQIYIVVPGLAGHRMYGLPNVQIHLLELLFDLLSLLGSVPQRAYAGPVFFLLKNTGRALFFAEKCAKCL